MFKMFLRNKARVFIFAAIFAIFSLSGSSFADIRLVLSYPTDVFPQNISLDVYAGVPTSSTIQESNFPAAFENAATITRIRPEIEGGNSWIIKQPGTYCYFVRPKNLNPTNYDFGRIYAVVKVIWIDPSEWPGGASTYGLSTNGLPVITKTITKKIETGQMARNGFEPTWDPFLPKLDTMPYNYFTGTPKTDGRDRTQGLLPDEMDHLYGTSDIVGFPAGGFKTPTFTNRPRAMYQASTQDEMVKFTKDVVSNSPRAYWFNLADAIDNVTGEAFGKTPYLQYDIPLIIVTKEIIPASATFAEAAKIIRESGKLNYWHNAQIHANETSSGEGAMAMLLDMAGSYGEQFLDRLNYICIPRYNVEGSYIWQRTNARNIDMNRDHMRLKTVETRMMHKAYLEIMPHVCEDGHEYDFFAVARSTIIPNTGALSGDAVRLAGLPAMAMYNKSGSSSMAADDMQTTPASSLNNPSWEVNDLAMELYGVNVYKGISDAGLRIYHYGETSNNAIGRAWMGLMGSVSFVVEIRGLGAGPVNYERRTFAHYKTAQILLETAYANHTQTMDLIAKGRQAMIDKGKKFDTDDLIAINFNSSSAADATRPGKNLIPYTGTRITHNMKGEEVSKTLNSTATRYNNITRSRPRPTAYVIPKGINRSTADGITTISTDIDYAVNYEYLLNLMKWQGIHYYEVPEGTSAPVKQYYRSDTGNVTTGSSIADLRDEKTVIFEKGAYVVPMDQVAGAVIAMLFEPDPNGSASYNASVAQTVSGAEGFALMFHDVTTRDYPLYRLEKDNPREVLKEEKKEEPKPKPDLPECIEDLLEQIGCNMGYGLLIFVFVIPFVLKKRR